MENVKDSSFSYTEYSSPEELPTQLKLLIEKAYEAISSSHSPYSKFAVGAAILLENGEIILGSNQENGAYPSGLCAERVALFYAGSAFPKMPVIAIAIAASYKGVPTAEPVSPCGGCRQVMLETRTIGKKPIQLLMVGKNRILMVQDVTLLLPFNFTSIEGTL